MKNLNFSKLLNILDEIKNSYYDSYGVIKKDTQQKGILYKLSKNLNDQEKAEFQKYSNVKVLIAQAQYAPELKSTAILIFK